jgi:flagellar biosynthesis protein FliP
VKVPASTVVLLAGVAGFWCLCAVAPAYAQAGRTPGFGIELTARGGDPELSTALRLLLALTIISLIPAALVAMTSFTRIIIVLSMLRQALGMQETPPNMVLIGLALFLTLFTMLPVATEINEKAVTPYLANKLTVQQAAREAVVPLKQFMVRYTRESDLALVVELGKGQPPKSIDDIQLVHLVPAFMLSELKTAFQIGFVVFLPFLLIDLIVSSVLMSMGMLMVPPAVISLPIKILMFVLIDGWSLIVRSLVGSFG